MSLRRQLLDVSETHQLNHAERRELFSQAGLLSAPASWSSRLAGAYLVGAMFMAALALVCWMAANWAGWSRPARVGVLEACLLGSAVLAWRLASTRLPMQVLLFFAIGVLFAGLGQVYQTGRDPWQLFALWALLGLPLTLAARSNALWIPWVAVVFIAVQLQHTDGGWDRPPPLEQVLPPLMLAGVLLQALRPAWNRWHGDSAWPLRWSALLFLVESAWRLGFQGHAWLLVGMLAVLLMQEWKRGERADLVYFAVLLLAGCIVVDLSIYRGIAEVLGRGGLGSLMFASGLVTLLTLGILTASAAALRALAGMRKQGGLQ